MESNFEVKMCCMNISCVLVLTFLKLTGEISVSWFCVFLPIIVMLSLFALLFFGIVLYLYFKGGKKEIVDCYEEYGITLLF